MPELMSAVVFDEIKKNVASKPELVKKVNAIYTWVLTKDGKEVGRYTIDLKTGKVGQVYSGDPKDGAKAGVTLTLADENMLKLVDGSLNAQKAFMQGKLKIKGNLMLTQKLQTLFESEKSKL